MLGKKESSPICCSSPLHVWGLFLEHLQSPYHWVIFHHQLLVYFTLVFSTVTCGAMRRVRVIGEAGDILSACDTSSVNYCWERKKNPTHCTYFSVTEYYCCQKMSSHEHPSHPERKEGEACTATSGVTSVAEASLYFTLDLIWSAFIWSSYSLCIKSICQVTNMKRGWL